MPVSDGPSSMARLGADSAQALFRMLRSTNRLSAPPHCRPPFLPRPFLPRPFLRAVSSAAVSSVAVSSVAVLSSVIPNSAFMLATRSCSFFIRRASAAAASASSAFCFGLGNDGVDLFFGQPSHRHQVVRFDDRKILITEITFLDEFFGQFNIEAIEH